MSEFVSKKRGEVLAFSRVGLELVERGGEAATAALGGAEKQEKFVAELNRFAQAIEADANETTTTKADKTADKLTGMMEAYIGEEWDNSVELLEWLSFYSGSASAHWALVEGATNDDVAKDAHEFFHSVLHDVVHSLQALGKEKAGE